MNFIALDFETTGTDPKTDRVIQVGAVRMNGEHVLDRYVSFVHLGASVPIRVKRLTGISEADLRDAPPASLVFQQLLDFIGTDFVTAHNASFEKAFLEAETARLGLPSPRIRFVDTVEYARLACPEMSVHRLDTLAASLEVPLPRHHDAESDAETCGVLYTRLTQRLQKLGRETLELILLIGDDEWPLKEHIALALASAESKPFRPGARDASLLEPLKPEQEPAPVNTEQLARLLEPGGPVASAFANYEHRREQVQLMALVADAFNDGRHLLAEAGTGTGKSLAYLIPAAQWAMQNSDHIIISTHTINLQEQLLRNDIPLLIKSLGWDLRVSLLKGRSNYVCLRRLNDLLNHDLLALNSAERRALARFLSWLSLTASGDKGEVSVYGPADSVWEAVSAKTGACAAARCPYRERCFVNAARKRAAASHIIIANHSLVFSDIASNNKVLPGYSRLVFDEAHHLEDSAALHLGIDLALSELHQLIAEWSSVQSLMTRLQRLPISPEDREGLTDLLVKASTEAQKSQGRLHELGASLTTFMSSAEQEWSGRLCIRLTPQLTAEDSWVDVHIAAGNAVLALKAVATELGAFAALGANESMPDQVLDLAQQASSASLALAESASAIDTILCSNDEETVAWLEAMPDRPPATISLRSAPVDVSGLLRDRLFDSLDSVVMTSATLAVEGRFGYVKSRLGLADLEPGRLIEEIIGSPFDYPHQALLCMPTDMPPVQKTSSGDLGRRVSQFVGDLVLEIGGRTLVLFTSHRLLQDVYHSLKPVCEANDICLLAQGVDGNRTRLIEELRSSDRTVVLGSNSFWEGVDVPGNSLSCVVMVRLPFWPPTMPVIQARQERLERSGQSSFANLSLPEAIIRFKQGFGRLVRTKTDKGCVIVVDQRISEGGSRYGHRFINSLPGPKVFSGTCSDIIRAVCEWVGVERHEGPLDK